MGKHFFWIILCLAFFLVSCERKASIAEIDNEIEDFLAGSEQYELKTSISVKTIFEGQTISKSEEISVYLQEDPYYMTYTQDNIVFTQYASGVDVHAITYDSTKQVEGKYLYEETIIALDEVNMELIDLPSKDIEVKRSSGSYVIEENVLDLLSESDTDIVKSLVTSVGAPEDMFDEATARMVISINDDEIDYVVTMDINIESIDLEMTITMDVHIMYATFETPDIEDRDLFYPYKSLHPLDIDIDDQIMFPADTVGRNQYRTYLEPGKYGFNLIQGDFDTGDDVNVILQHSETHDRQLTFEDVIDPHQSNQTYIETFYTIEEAGYYDLFIEFPFSNTPIIASLDKYEYESDGIESYDLIISESGEYTYDIEGLYDFFSVYVDVNEYTRVKVSNTNGSFIYYHDLDTFDYHYPYIENQEISLLNNEPFTFYLYDDESVSGTITIDVQKFETTTPDHDDIPSLTTTYDTYLFNGPSFPTQYLKLEIAEPGFYKFCHDIESGHDVTRDGIYTLDGDLVSNVEHEDILFLQARIYYYQSDSSDYSDRIYRVRYENVTDDMNTYNLAEIKLIDQLAGNLSDLNATYIDINYPSERIVNKFSITETTDIVVMNTPFVTLYKADGTRLSLVDDYDIAYFTYRLDPGSYVLVIGGFDDFSEVFFPYEYCFLFGELTVEGSVDDDLVYPDYDVLAMGETGQSTYDYELDVDGYIIEITALDRYQFTTNERIYIYEGRTLIDILYNNWRITLEPGIYTVLGVQSDSSDPWRVSYHVYN